jgi:hypothetical protein
VTIITYDGNYVAVDSLAMWGEYRNYDAAKLIVRDNTVFASCGMLALFAPMVEWCLAGANPLTCPAAYKEDLNTDLIVISPSVHRNESDKTTEVRPAGHRVSSCIPFLFPIPAPFASGCMTDFAMGAMAAGADAVEAVRLSCEHGTHVDMPIRCVDLRRVPYVVTTATTRKPSA